MSQLAEEPASQQNEQGPMEEHLPELAQIPAETPPPTEAEEPEENQLLILEEAISVLSEGLPEKALELFRSITGSLASSSSVRYGKAMALYQVEDVDASIAELTLLLEENPGHAKAREALASLMRGKELIGQAVARPKVESLGAPYPTAAPAAEPSAPEPAPRPAPAKEEAPEKVEDSEALTAEANRLVDEALNELEAEHDAAALEAIEKAAALKVSVQHVQYVRAMTLTRFDRLAEAAEALKKELSTFPENQPALDLLQQIEDELKNQAAAKEPAKETSPQPEVTPPPAEVETPPRKAPSAVIVKEDEQDTIAIKSPVEIEKEINKLIDSAIEELMNGKGAAALQAVERAFALDLVVRDLHHVRALALIQLEREAEAQISLEDELAAYPDNQPAQELLQQLIQQLRLQQGR